MKRTGLISSIQTWLDVRFLCNSVERTPCSQNHKEVGGNELGRGRENLMFSTHQFQEPFHLTNKESTFYLVQGEGKCTQSYITTIKYSVLTKEKYSG